ncbi:hypothetical protein STVIR_0925 [Streptomyces viridochromogenes Tue57]|uniref:Uncharacterized protein n=1 Tax=Streptomyces viridochromogenes Tue57 TaxID=1160705 RepID=L8PNT8_STRVR|nr:hypothetical protein STVIR_0925 [Streptomyces viridochromogenes Tue57]
MRVWGRPLPSARGRHVGRGYRMAGRQRSPPVWRSDQRGLPRALPRSSSGIAGPAHKPAPPDRGIGDIACAAEVSA